VDFAPCLSYHLVEDFCVKPVGDWAAFFDKRAKDFASGLATDTRRKRNIQLDRPEVISWAIIKINAGYRSGSA